MLFSQVITIVVAVSTFTTPLPTEIPLYGRAIHYGGQQLVEANAEFRGYDLSPYWNRCGAASMSPVDLGRIFWFVPTEGPMAGQVVGPCLFIDTSQRKSGHFYNSVYLAGETVEPGGNLRDAIGLKTGILGYLWVGLCPPTDLGFLSTPDPEFYAPPLEIDEWPYELDPRYYPYPAQQMPVDCSGPSLRESFLVPTGVKARKGFQNAPEPLHAYEMAWNPQFVYMPR